MRCGNVLLAAAAQTCIGERKFRDLTIAKLVDSGTGAGAVAETRIW